MKCINSAISADRCFLQSSLPFLMVHQLADLAADMGEEPHLLHTSAGYPIAASGPGLSVEAGLQSVSGEQRF